MPELPEVESLRRGLVEVIVGQYFKKVEIRRPKLIAGRGTKRIPSKDRTEQFEKETVNKKIIKISRRAKNLLIHFEDKSGILIHLKMSGQLVYQFKKSQKTVIGGHPIKESLQKLPNKHSHIIFELPKGYLYYNDVRQFGYLLYYSHVESIDQSGHYKWLGYEPLEPDFTLSNFKQKLKSKPKSILKKVFLDQTVVVGLGNIYTDEVCFASGVRPYRKIQTLKIFEIESLYKNIKNIIPVAIKMGGSSVANYLLADGKKGNYAKLHKVYNRGGKKCLVCSNILQKGKLAGRTTVWCNICQK